MTEPSIDIADAAAGDVVAIEDSTKSVPPRKRKKDESSGEDGSPEAKASKTGDGTNADDDLKPIKRSGNITKAREVRLEQNRKAARESRRRKKNMIEELQRSVVFFSRANSSLKQQNDELTRLLVQAQTQIAAQESGKQPATGEETSAAPPAPSQPVDPEQAQANAVATQAMFESQGFPAAAARTAAQTMNAGGTPAPAAAAVGTAQAPQPPPPLAAMQTGATMQAMANFQQATAVSDSLRCYLLLKVTVSLLHDSY